MLAFFERRNMLKLDEEKIWKGKPVGLPYQGSKKKIAKKIVEIIKQNFGTDKPIYDVFGGGGAITTECILNGLEVHYNDIDKSIIDSFQKIVSSDREYLKTLLCSRSEFLIIREKEIKTVDDELKLLVSSFGNNRKNYLYNENVSDLKYNLAIEIIEHYGCFSNYKQTSIYKKYLGKIDGLNQLEQLSRLQQLERLQQLVKSQQLELDNKYVTNYSYEAFSDIEGAIFYLDPPYENAAGYSRTATRKPEEETYKQVRLELSGQLEGYELERDGFIFKLGTGSNNKNRMYYRDIQSIFKSQKFYDWAYEMSKRNIVLISSYEISDPRFETVFEFKTARSTLQGGMPDGRYEKLFMVK